MIAIGNRLQRDSSAISMFKPYRDIDGDSGIVGYDYESDWICVQFRKGAGYRYTSSGIGSVHLEAMKRLADSGEGLNAYINRYPSVKKAYSSRC